MDTWSFLTNHAHVLVCIARDPDVRVRGIALHVGVTERAALRILHDLEDGGYLRRERQGRRTTYHINPSLPLRHPLEAHRGIGELLRLLDIEHRGT